MEEFYDNNAIFIYAIWQQELYPNVNYEIFQLLAVCRIHKWMINCVNLLSLHNEYSRKVDI